VKEKLQTIVENSPVDYLEIRLETHVTNSLSFQGKELEDIGEKESQGGCVRACHKGGWGFSSFNLFGDLDRAVREAVEQSKCIGKGKTKLRYAAPVTGDYIQTEGKSHSFGFADCLFQSLLCRPYLPNPVCLFQRHPYYAEKNLYRHYLCCHGKGRHERTAGLSFRG
jgi:hypothetical protein